MPHVDDWWDEQDEIDLDFEHFDDDTGGSAMKWQVKCNGRIILNAKSVEDADALLERIKTGNRWAGLEPHRITIAYMTGDPDAVELDDVDLMWKAVLRKGHSGWDLYPYGYLESKDMQENIDFADKSIKEVHVRAASALDAIEHAKFKLIVGGYHHE